MGEGGGAAGQGAVVGLVPVGAGLVYPDFVAAGVYDGLPGEGDLADGGGGGKYGCGEVGEYGGFDLLGPWAGGAGGGDGAGLVVVGFAGGEAGMGEGSGGKGAVVDLLPVFVSFPGPEFVGGGAGDGGSRRR